MTLRRVALALLGLLALLLGGNLVGAARNFYAAYETYDELALDLSVFDYTSPDEPVATELTVSNPSDREVKIVEVELWLDAGVHRVGGGRVRPQQQLAAGGSESYPVDIRIFDQDYIERRAGESPDWQLSGRIQIVLDPNIDPEWITFSVQRLPTREAS